MDAEPVPAPLIRALRPRDVPAVLNLLHTIPNAPQWPDAEIEAAAVACPVQGARYRLAWVATLPDQPATLLGFTVASFLHTETWAECDLEYIAVLPQARTQGIGTLLLQAVIEAARAIHAEAIRLEVRASNRAAIRLYESAGFRRTGVRCGYYPTPAEDALLFEMAIPNA